MKHPIRWAARALAAALIITVSLVAGAGFASAHTLSPIGTFPICVVQPDGSKLFSVSWTFQAAHTTSPLATVSFSRSVHASDFTATLIHAYTVEQAGTTATLTAHATWADGFPERGTIDAVQSQYIDPNLGCSGPTATTTEPPTTTTTIEALTTVPDTTTTAAPAEETTTTTSSTVPALLVIGHGGDPKADATAMVKAKAVAAPAQLPSTGSSDSVPLAAFAFGTILVGVILVLARRVPADG